MQIQFYFWLIVRFCMNLLVLYCEIIFFIMTFFKILKILLQIPEFKRKMLLRFEFYSFLYLAIVFCAPEVELWHMPKFFLLLSVTILVIQEMRVYQESNL